MTSLYRLFWLWLLALGLPQLAAAQGQQVRYREGRAQLDQGHYAAAMRQLEPLTQPVNHFAQAADAAYLYAVAASRAGQWAEAEQMLNLIRNRYPTYYGLGEVLYLQGQASFEQGDYDTALRTLGQLPADKYGAAREAMQATYLPRLQDRTTWQRLQRRYPQSKLVGRLYADFLAKNPAPTDADRQQIAALVQQFGLDRAAYAAALSPAAARPVARKSSYNVAILLPFLLDDTSWQTRRDNQFVTDLYAGMRLAQDSLQRAGRTVQLFAYDTGADTLTLKNVLALPELAGMDMLIGPVYKSGAKILARYAREHQIICINPLSQDGSLVADNPYHYLFSSSAATQGRAAAEFAARSFGTARPAVVLHETGKDDLAFVTAFQTTFQAAGGRIAAVHPLTVTDATSLGTALLPTELTGAGLLVMATDERKAATAAFTALGSIPVANRPALLAPGAWLDDPYLGIGQLSGPYFYHPKFVDQQRPGYRRFRQLYLARQKLPPSVFAGQGFELLLYFGAALQQFGPSFQASLAEEPVTPGVLLDGIAYPSGAHDNQIVPIVRLNGLEYQVQR